ncbi:MAG TPA: hypothetical protein PKC30_09365 [Saprospiraceae bacterium]|nr:hypothetical protein [Saprospiraceae bacterium]
MMKKITPLSRVLLLVASLLLVILYYVPFWEILMWAPQYPEGLTMKIWLNRFSGDVEIINGLNHYIGMKHIKTEMFKEFEIMPQVVAGIIALGLLSVIWGRRAGVWIFLIVMMIAGITGLVDFWLWGYDYGHNLDPKAAIKVPGMAYQPPLIGTKTLLNFVAYSGPDTGGWIVVATGVITMFVLVFENYKERWATRFRWVSPFISQSVRQVQTR